MSEPTAPVRGVRTSLLPGSAPVDLDPRVVAPGEHGSLLDGTPIEALLERHDQVHATLAAPAASEDRHAGRHAVLLLPGTLPGPAGATSVEVVVDGWRFQVLVEDAALADLRDRARRGRAVEGASRPSEVRAMIPGRVASVAVAAGQAVEAGDPLLVIEAMKMQNELRAPRAGTVVRVIAEAGRNVEAGELLAIIE